MRCPSRGVLCLMALAIGSSPLSAAFAQASTGLLSVDDGWQRMQDADFEGAVQAFDEAERGALSRAQLVRALEGRAHVHYALGEEAALRSALVRLAAIAPEHRFAPETPPELIERFREHTGEQRLELEVEMQQSEGEARVEARASGDPGGLVRHLRVAARVDEGEWLSAEDEPLRLPVDASRALAWYGEAIGPGGAIVASDGTREAPHSRAAANTDTDDAPWLWIGLGAGAAVVVGIVIAAVAVALQPADTQPSAPMFP